MTQTLPDGTVQVLQEPDEGNYSAFGTTGGGRTVRLEFGQTLLEPYTVTCQTPDGSERRIFHAGRAARRLRAAAAGRERRLYRRRPPAGRRRQHLRCCLLLPLRPPGGRNVSFVRYGRKRTVFAVRFFAAGLQKRGESAIINYSEYIKVKAYVSETIKQVISRCHTCIWI